MQGGDLQEIGQVVLDAGFEVIRDPFDIGKSMSFEIIIHDDAFVRQSESHIELGAAGHDELAFALRLLHRAFDGRKVGSQEHGQIVIREQSALIVSLARQSD